MAHVTELQKYLTRQWHWSKKVFGPGLRTSGIIAHIKSELDEIEANPHDLSEWIDVIILALDGYWRHGGTGHMLQKLLQEKQDRNFARDWPPYTGDDAPVFHLEPGTPIQLRLPFEDPDAVSLS